MLRTMVLALVVALSAGPRPAAAVPAVTADAAGRVTLELTVYAQDLALIRDVRVVEVPRGESRLEFRDVPARLDPATVRVTAGPDLAVLEQDYEFDLVSPDRILERCVGGEVAWIQEDGSVVTGTLLSTNGGPVFRVGERIVFEMPGRIALPDLPEGLHERPALAWTVRADRAGPVEVETSYLTGGLSWTADYALEVDEQGRTAGLQAWVSLDNRCGAGFAAAGLRLVAGDIRRVGNRPAAKAMLEMAARADDAFQEQAVHDYHVYALDRPVTLEDRQLRQFALLSRQGVPVTRLYRLRAGAAPLRADGTQPVEVVYRFVNAEETGLGLPLPAGTVRIYGRDGDGLQLLGEDRLGHTPRGEAVELVAGSAFDLVAERVLLESRRLGERDQQSNVRITLRNRKTADVTVEILETVGGDWRVTASTLPARRVDARTLAFAAPVPAGGETVVEYTVEVAR